MKATTLASTPNVRLDLRFAEDPAAQRFVSEHPDGATAREVAAFLDVPVWLVEYIERVGREHMAKRLRLVGIGAGDLPHRGEHPLAGTWAEGCA